MIQSSGVKGAFRDLAETLWPNAPEDVAALFGREAKRTPGHETATQPGALSFTDARLLALPVRSSVAPFVWVGCPSLVARLARDLALIGWNGVASTVEAPGDKALGFTETTGTIVLEDLALPVGRLSLSPSSLQDATIDTIMRQAAGSLWSTIKERWFLVSDEHFQFLAENATEVQPRIALGPNKTTDDGGNLWYQEVLPSETLLYTMVFAAAERKANGQGLDDAAVLQKAESLKTAGYIQMGGDETLGRGIFEMAWVNGTGS